MERKWKIILPVAIALVAVIVLLNVISNKVTYQNAEELLAQGEYLKAQTTFQSVADYKDSMDRIKECDYQLAVEQMNNGEFDSATTNFLKISKYNDAEERCTEAYQLWYEKCEDMFEAGDLINAVSECQKLRDKAYDSHKGIALKASNLLLKAEKGIYN